MSVNLWQQLDERSGRDEVGERHHVTKLWIQVALLQSPDHLQGSIVETAQPEVGQQFIHERAHVLHELSIERCPGREGILPQDPLAETVDGIDGGAVEVQQSIQ